MPTQLQIRRGSSAENDAFTGASGELTFDTTNNRVRVHDGATQGGYELKTETSGGDTLFADNEKAIFGAGNDLQIYHDGLHSYIHDSGTGDLIVRAENFRLTDAGNTEYMMQAVPNGAVTLYYNGVSKLATTSTGVDITGEITTDGMTTSAVIKAPDGSAAAPAYTNSGDTDGGMYFPAANQVALAAGGTERLLVNSTGVDVTGTIKVETTTGGLITLKRDDTTLTNNADVGAINFETTDTDDAGVGATILGSGDGTSGGMKLRFYTGTASDKNERLLISSNGDISFYEDTGTTPKFFWDASAESLGVGTTSPDANLHVFKGESGGATPNSQSSLVLENSTNTYLQFLTPATNESGMLFGDDDNDRGGLTYNHSSDFMAFTVAAAPAMRIDSSRNLIVGNTSVDASSSVSLKSDGNIRQVLASGVVSDTLIGGISGVSNGHQISIDASNNQTYKWHNGGTQSMTLDSSGNLLVGQTSLNYNAIGSSLSAGGTLRACANSYHAASFNRKTLDGDIATFYKDGSTVGSIGTTGGRLYIGDGTVALRIVGDADEITPWNATGNTNRDAAIALGNSTNRFKDLYLSGTINLGGTAPTNRKLYSESTTYPQQNYMTTSGVNYPTLQLRNAYATGGQTATQIDFRNGADAAVGTITSTVSSTAYNTSSDYRLKTDAQSMTGATDRLKQLNPVNFEWIVDGTRVDGFLAHEAQAVVPEAVTGTKDAMRDEEYEVTPEVLDDDGNVVTEAVMGTRSVPDYQGIDQSKLVPLLVATIKELEARITALENA